MAKEPDSEESNARDSVSVTDGINPIIIIHSSLAFVGVAGTIR